MGVQGNAVTAGMVGALLGGFVAYLIRPASMLIGQLPWYVVLTRGAMMDKYDRAIWGDLAQTSFNYLLAGLLIGAILGAIGAFLYENLRRQEHISDHN